MGVEHNVINNTDHEVVFVEIEIKRLGLEPAMDMMTSPLATLADPGLFKTDALIGGEWVTHGASGLARFDVTDPATGLKLADVANLGPVDCHNAIVAADKAWGPWRSKTAKERAAVLMKWFCADPPACRRPGPHHDGRTGQAAGRGAWRGGVRRQLHRVVRRRSQAGLWRDHPDHRQQQALHRHQAAHRRVRGHHALELPDRDDHPQGGAGAGRRLHAW